MSKHDFGEARIKELEKEIERIKKVAEDLVVTAFAISELRDLWRRRFGIEPKADNGDMD